MPLKNMSKTLLAALPAAMLCGCGMDDVQLNGKVFDAVGMNATSSVDRKTIDLKQRAGIVIPPDLSSLPPPGSGSGSAPDIAEVQDYDAKHTTSREDMEKKQAEYCAKHYDMAKAMGNQDETLVEGPLGRCQKSILSLTGFGNKQQPDDDQ